jgi:hypothetical protein
MFISSASSFEVATVTDVTLVAGDVAKVTKLALPDRGSAEVLCGQLETYHAALAAGPLAVPELVNAEVLEQADGYHVRHVVELVDGLPLTRLTEEERRVAIGGLVHTVQEMPAPPHAPGRLLTPIDAKLRNFVLHGDKPVLVDVCPPFTWGEDGLVQTALIPDMDIASRAYSTGIFGGRSGVLAELLIGAAPSAHQGESALHHMKRVVGTAPGWYADLVPPDLSPTVTEDLSIRLGVKLSAFFGRALFGGK